MTFFKKYLEAAYLQKVCLCKHSSAILKGGPMFIMY